LRVLGGVGGTVGVDDLGIKDSEAVAMPETNGAFVSAGVGFGSEGGGADLIEGGVSGIVGILMSPEEDRRFMDDGFCAEGHGAEMSPFISNFRVAERDETTFFAVEGVGDGKGFVAAVTGVGEVFRDESITEAEIVTEFFGGEDGAISGFWNDC